jgi:hypothetical protein
VRAARAKELQARREVELAEKNLRLLIEKKLELELAQKQIRRGWTLPKPMKDAGQPVAYVFGTPMTRQVKPSMTGRRT